MSVCRLIGITFTLIISTVATTQAALVGQWTFDDLTANDSVGSSHGSVGSNVTLVTPGLAGTAGAADFAGASHSVNNAITLGGTLDQVQNVSGATVVAWVQPTVIDGTVRVILSMSVGDSSNARFNLAVAGNTFRVGARAGDDDSFHSFFAPITPTAGEVFLVAGVADYANDTLRIHVGKQWWTLTDVGFNATATSNTESQVGRIGGSNYTGLIDEVHLYNEVLSVQQVLAFIPEPTTVLLLGALLMPLCTAQRRMAASARRA